MRSRKYENENKKKISSCKLGGGVLYRMFVTVSSADRERGRSFFGRGGGVTLCDVL